MGERVCVWMIDLAIGEELPNVVWN